MPDAKAGRPADPNAEHRARMRERMLRAGGEGFADYELLEYLLTIAFRQGDTKPLARALIAEFGSLAAVLAAAPEALRRVDGMGPAAAAGLKFIEAAALRATRIVASDRPLIAGSEPLSAYLHAAHAHLIKEEVRVLFLDSRNHLIRDEVMAKGTINQANVHPREVVDRAIQLGAAGLILVHNHPSGDATPSRADIAITHEIVAAAKLLEIMVHDHVIVGRAGHTSLRAAGLM